MEIREGEVADLPMICEKGKIFNELAKDGYGKFLKYNPKDVLSGVNRAVNAGGKFWVLWNKDDFAGIILGYVTPSFYDNSQKVAICAFVAVLPEFQRTQWGKKLMLTFEDWAKDRADFIAYDGYDRKFSRAMKKRGFYKTGYRVMKEL